MVYPNRLPSVSSHLPPTYLSFSPETREELHSGKTVVVEGVVNVEDKTPGRGPEIEGRSEDI